MKSKRESKFDRTELILWVLFGLLFLVMAGFVWIVVTNRLSASLGPLG